MLETRSKQTAVGLDLHNWVINCQLLFSLWGITVSRRASLLLLPCKECGKDNLILSEEIRLLSISVVIDNALRGTGGCCHTGNAVTITRYNLSQQQ